MNLLPAVSTDYLSTYQNWFVLVTFARGMMVEADLTPVDVDFFR